MSLTKRIVFFDIARALCILWIVGVWHWDDYIHDDAISSFIAHNFGMFTTATLACFTFISGFFLGKRNVNAGEFYMTRLKRIYLPFLVSCLILLCVGWFRPPAQFLLTLTGLSCFFPPQPGTMWYLAMLIVFYALTPLLLSNDQGGGWGAKFLFKAFIVFVLFHILWKAGHCDRRVLMYFPYYIAGICLRTGDVVGLITDKLCVVVSVLFLVLLCFLPSDYVSIGKVLKPMIGVYLLFVISYVMEHRLPQKAVRFFSAISYASMFAYLFHREGYCSFVVLENVFGIRFPAVVFSALTVVIFVASYYTQRLYNSVLKRILEKRAPQ